MKAGLLILISLFTLTVAAQKKPVKRELESIFYEYVKYDESTDSPENKERMTKALKEAGNKKLINCIPIIINIYIYYTVTDYPSGSLATDALTQMPKEALALVEKRIIKEKKTHGNDEFPVSDLLLLKEKISVALHQ